MAEAEEKNDSAWKMENMNVCSKYFYTFKKKTGSLPSKLDFQSISPGNKLFVNKAEVVNALQWCLPRCVWKVSHSELMDWRNLNRLV